MAAKAKSGPAAAATGTKETGGGGKRPNALQKPLRPSKELAAVVGAGPLPRGEAVSKVWAYIKQHGLQDPQDRRAILADYRVAIPT